MHKGLEAGEAHSALHLHGLARRILLDMAFDLGDVLGRRAAAAADGLDAVRQASQLRPDVLVADIAMPEMNGIEATRQIRELSPDTQVVMLSMHSTPDHIAHVAEHVAKYKPRHIPEIAPKMRLSGLEPFVHE